MEFHLKKSLGQNFLKDQNILRKEVSVANVTGKKVLEIGPGDGGLTQMILEANPSRLTVIEKDERFAYLLKDKFKTTISIVKDDFLKHEFTDDFDVIIGNIPYYITSPIIFKVKDMKFERAVFIVQKEFAMKMIANPNDSNYGRLSVTSQLFFEVKYIQTISRRVFSPVPRVDSAMIELKRTNSKLDSFDQDIVRYLFQHKNQSVKKSLGHSKQFSKEQLEKLNDYSKVKVRTLTKEEVLKIVGIMKESKK
ncbi:MAG: 16S rRNA (adenine(1518)-N(6)/adenine(1519)-N(6))-dimethyltransferase RsmA [Candidatus Micrarchaeota archaeon]